MRPLALAPAALAALLLTACGAPAAESSPAPPATSRPGPVLPRPGSTPARPAEASTAATASDTSPPATRPPRPATTRPAAPNGGRRPDAVPAKLVGSWVSTGGGNAEMIYEFDADGVYRYAGVILQQRPSGVFSFEIGATGRASFTGSRLTLRPERGTQTLKDPDAADGGWQRPISTEQQVLRWRMSGGRLQITDTESITVTYRRQ
jgi:hypothetical protein